MAKENSFDIVSEFDYQELVNAVDIAKREITTRYDLKDAKIEITLEKEQLVLACPSDFTLKAVYEILQAKSIKRGLSLKIFDPQKIEPATMGTVRQTILFRKGLTAEQAKKLGKQIREQLPKVKIQIQGEALRVNSKSIDELQEVIALVKSLDFEAPLQCENYR